MRLISSLALLLVSAPALAEPTIHGSLLRQGKPLDFATAPLRPEGVRCRESDQKALSLHLNLPADASPYHVVDTVVAFSATPGLVKIGEKREPQLASRSYEPERDRWGRVLAWIGPKDRVTQATLPKAGWVRYRSLDKMGPIELEFDLDFGELGHISGRARTESTAEIVCLIPSPPPPAK